MTWGREGVGTLRRALVPTSSRRRRPAGPRGSRSRPAGLAGRGRTRPQAHCAQAPAKNPHDDMEIVGIVQLFGSLYSACSAAATAYRSWASRDADCRAASAPTITRLEEITTALSRLQAAHAPDSEASKQVLGDLHVAILRANEAGVRAFQTKRSAAAFKSELDEINKALDRSLGTVQFIIGFATHSKVEDLRETVEKLRLESAKRDAMHARQLTELREELRATSSARGSRGHSPASSAHSGGSTGGGHGGRAGGRAGRESSLSHHAAASSSHTIDEVRKKLQAETVARGHAAAAKYAATPTAESDYDQREAHPCGVRELSEYEVPGTYSCDVCGAFARDRFSSGDSTWYQCKDCHYDECRPCLENGPTALCRVEPPRPPTPPLPAPPPPPPRRAGAVAHPCGLVKTLVATGKGWRVCNVCRRARSKGKVPGMTLFWYKCRACSWDECQQCFDTGPSLCKSDECDAFATLQSMSEGY